MSELDKFFKFKVRDVVRHMGSECEQQPERAWSLEGKARYFVIARSLYEYPNGMHIEYVARSVGPGGKVVQSTTKFDESELVLSEPFQDEKSKGENA